MTDQDFVDSLWLFRDSAGVPEPTNDQGSFWGPLVLGALMVIVPVAMIILLAVAG